MMRRSIPAVFHAGDPYLMAALLLAAVLQSCVPVSKPLPRRPDSTSVTGTDSVEIPFENLIRVRQARIFGEGNESSPPILRLPEVGKSPMGIGSDALTLSVDVQAPILPNPVLQLVHCDRNWIPTESIFIQDVVKLRSDNFRVVRAPSSIRFYDYTMEITFPGVDQNIHIEHSGNYLARILDYYHRDRVLAEARFFVVESKATASISIISDFYQSAQTKIPQRGLRARVEAVPAIDLYSTNLNAVHMYRDAHWYSPWIADEQSSEQQRRDGEVWPVWDAFFGSHTTAQFLNIPAANEYRLLDLTDISLYPPVGTVITTPLSDLPGNSLGYPDNNGTIHPRLLDYGDYDYVLFEFRLDLKGREARQDIFVVGTFNNWIPSPEWQLQYDAKTRFYTVRGWIRRSYHEYQYVAGNWDSDKSVLRNAEATLLEGNISMSTHSYCAFVYYHDIRLGGFDRIIGVGRSEGSFW